MNDRSLSDWQGVIGEEISAQREVQEEREEMLHDLLDRFDSLQHAMLGTTDTQHEAGEGQLYSEIASIRSELRLLASQISGIPLAPVRLPKKKEVKKPCPKCGHILEYRQKSKAKNVKNVDCTKCGARLASREADGDFILAVREPVLEAITCPSCGQNSSMLVDPVPGSVLDVDCPRCKVRLRISRAHTGLRMRLPGPPKPIEPGPVLAEEFLEKVAELMGPQPWPKGQSMLAAAKLEVNHRLVNRATQELIHRGAFKPQIDGKLYVPEEH